MGLLGEKDGKFGRGKGGRVHSYNSNDNNNNNSDNNSRSSSRTLRQNPLATMTPIILSAPV
jgi:hypothetical protein